MAGNIRISESEWIIMRFLWENGARQAAAIIDGVEADTGWKPSTVKTMLSRLVEKGALRIDPGERAQVYIPLITKDVCARKETGTLLKRFFGGSSKLLVSSFIESGEITASELAELRELLDKHSPPRSESEKD